MDMTLPRFCVTKPPAAVRGIARNAAPPAPSAHRQAAQLLWYGAPAAVASRTDRGGPARP
jgi:hypothetical protein